MGNIEKTERIEEIRFGLNRFCEQHLNEEYNGYADKLLEKLSRKRTLDIYRGQWEIWASAIIYVIARLNFLFDSQNPVYITADTITEFFGTKKSTSSQKATLIENECKIYIGDPEFCRSEITEALTFVRTSEGFIVPKTMLHGKDQLVDIIDPEEKTKLDAKLDESRRRKQEEKLRQEEEMRRQKAEEKRKRMKEAGQQGLFE